MSHAADATGYDQFAPALLVRSVGSLRLLTMNRPHALNAMDLELHDALAEVWNELACDRDARAVVLTGAGRAFSAGGDLHHLRALQQDPVLRRRDLDYAARIVRAITACPLPVVAAVNGPAVGLGATLAVLCDIVLIASDTYLADPHVGLGLTAADGGVSLWPLHTSLHKAKEYLLTGDRIPADVAVAIGLANRVVDGDVVAAALDLGHRLAAQPRQAVSSTKELLNRHASAAIGQLLDDALDHEYASFDEAEHVAAVARLSRREEIGPAGRA